MSQAVFFFPPTLSTASVKKGLMGKGGGRKGNNQATKINKTKHCHKKPLEFMKKIRPVKWCWNSWLMCYFLYRKRASTNLYKVVCVVILLGLHIENRCSFICAISNCKNCKFAVIWDGYHFICMMTGLLLSQINKFNTLQLKNTCGSKGN